MLYGLEQKLKRLVSFTKPWDRIQNSFFLQSEDPSVEDTQKEFIEGSDFQRVFKSTPNKEFKPDHVLVKWNYKSHHLSQGFFSFYGRFISAAKSDFV